MLTRIINDALELKYDISILVHVIVEDIMTLYR